MNRRLFPFLAGLWLVSCFCVSPRALGGMALDPFEGHTDIGKVQRSGDARYEAGQRTYVVRGGGSNMWFGSDAFHLIWKRVSGDVCLSAGLEWSQSGGQPHRKAGVMLRQSLDPGAPYVDAVIHGDGLTSLQYREVVGGPTREVQAPVKRPARLRLERWGDFVSMSVLMTNELWAPSGCAVRLLLTNPVYAGLLVCAHDDSALEEARFRQVQLVDHPFAGLTPPPVRSVLEMVPIASGDRRVVYHTTNLIQATRWSPDGNLILFSRQETIYRLPSSGGAPELAEADLINHSATGRPLSPDGKWTVSLAAEPAALGRAVQFPDAPLRLMPAMGGEARVLARLFSRAGLHQAPCWSPDGRALVYASYPPDLSLWLARRDRWEKEITAFEVNEEVAPPPQQAILFLGSSTMRLWQTLAQDFPGLTVISRGFGGSQIADSTYYADRIVFPHHPKQIVFYAGDNDLAEHKSPSRVRDDIQAFANRIHERLPETRITFLAIKPSLARWAWVDKIQRANQLIREYCQAHPWLQYIDTYTPTLGPDGKPRADLFAADGLHLNRLGYGLWAAVIRPAL